MYNIYGIFTLLLPTLLAMTIMTATAVGLSRESFFLGATAPVILFRAWGFLASSGIDIERTELLATFPAPGSATAGPYLEGAHGLQAACKDIVTRGILQGPAFAPRTLLRVR